MRVVWSGVRGTSGAESISVGKREEDGRTEIQITYRFGPPPDSEAESGDDSSMPQLKNGSRS